MTTLDDIAARDAGITFDTEEPPWGDPWNIMASDRRFLITLVREAKVQIEVLLEGSDRTEDDPARRFLLRLTEGSDRT